MQTGVNKIGGDVFEIGPFAGGVGEDNRNIVGAAKFYESEIAERFVADFDGVAHRIILFDFEIRFGLEVLIGMFAESGGGFLVGRERF